MGKLLIISLPLNISEICALISTACTLISIIAIVFLIKDKLEKSRPYLQISFELIRSTLTCIVIRNVGNVPLTIKSIKFDKFIDQLPPNTIKRLEKLDNANINIYSNNKLIISFDNNVFDIINDFDNKQVNIEYHYTNINKNKYYKEKTSIDFEEYSGMLLYLSELDEFKQSTDKIVKSLEKITKLGDKNNNYIEK